jgi:hypothetical protein
MKCIIAGLTVLVGMTAAAHSQSSGPATPGQPVHPGTAILDSMGIFAGMPVPDPKTNRNAVAASTVAPDQAELTTARWQLQ